MHAGQLCILVAGQSWSPDGCSIAVTCDEWDHLRFCTDDSPLHHSPSNPQVLKGLSPFTHYKSRTFCHWRWSYQTGIMRSRTMSCEFFRTSSSSLTEIELATCNERTRRSLYGRMPMWTMPLGASNRLAKRTRDRRPGRVALGGRREGRLSSKERSPGRTLDPNWTLWGSMYAMYVYPMSCSQGRHARCPSFDDQFALVLRKRRCPSVKTTQDPHPM